MRALSALCALLAAAAATASGSVAPTAMAAATEMDSVSTEMDSMSTETMTVTETDFVSTEMSLIAMKTATALTETIEVTETASMPTETVTAGTEDECPSPAPSLLLTTDQDKQDHTIAVNGGELRVQFANGEYLAVSCSGGATLDGALPRVRAGTRVRNATLACAPPRCAGYARALERLGVRLASPARLALRLPRAGEPLASRHLAGLRLSALELSASAPRRPPPAPRADALRLLALPELLVRDVPLPPDALLASPSALRKLLVMEAAPRVPAAALRTLTSLVARGATLEGEAPALRRLSLTLREAEPAPAWSRFPALTTLALIAWREPRPARWEACGALRSLLLTFADAEALPARWLAACPALERLELNGARRLRELPAALLEGAGGGASPALERLALRYGALDSLPQALFDPLPNLRHLDLTGNHLHALPGGIFTSQIKLVTLNLSKNKFMGNSAYLGLGPLTNLKTLNLSYNRRLGDACTGDADARFDSGYSELQQLKGLTELNLCYTEVTHICRDWREGMRHLLYLRLCHTNITRLSFNDLQYEREIVSVGGKKPEVDLRGSRVSTVEYSKEEAARALTLGAALVSVRLSEPLLCDCELFYALRALRRNPRHVDLVGSLQCAGGEPLTSVELDELLCPVGVGAGCPERCDCAAREESLRGEPSWRLRANCEDRGLTALPALPALNGTVRWDLRLARNRIAAVDDLPSDLLRLDLRNNSVRTVSARAALALRSAGSVLLAGNPRLACDCGAASLLGAAAALGAALPPRLDAARCAGGGLLSEAAARCGAGAGAALLAGLGAAAAALALAALGAGAALARPATRARLKAVLLGWGWLPRGAEEEEARRYDAFVAYAHSDSAWVRQLAARLEAEGLRLCLHSRDWAPGEHIAAQIAASVRSARRTVAVVSRGFLRSQWARAELREALGAEAREGRPRLLVLLREEPGALPLDRELRRYIAANTYLRTDHPRFLPLLRKALPAPRPAPAPAPPTPA